MPENIRELDAASERDDQLVFGLRVGRFVTAGRTLPVGYGREIDKIIYRDVRRSRPWPSQQFMAIGGEMKD